MKTLKLSSRQRSALLRLKKAEKETGIAIEQFSPDLANQLHKKGLATLTGHKRHRTEWNRKVPGSTLWEVRLTDLGREIG